MDYTRLRHIVAVAHAGTFSRAADELNMTQPALSRSIAAFEAQYDVQLFDRGRNGAALTPGGQLVVDQATAILAATGDLKRSLGLFAKGEAGRISFGLGPLLASLILPALCRSVLRSHPDLQLFTLTKPADHLIAELLDDNIEMVFGNSWHLGQYPHLVKERIGALELAMIVRSGHPLIGQLGLSLADLAGFPVATAVELPAAGLAGRGGAFICDNFHILRDAVLETDCIWLSAPAFVASELNDGRLARLEVADLWPAETDICVVYRQGRTRSPIASAIATEVGEMLGVMGGEA